jgi:hypothetical protein
MYLMFHSIFITQKKEKINLWLFEVDYNFFDFFLLSATKCGDYLSHISAVDKPWQLWSKAKLLVAHLYQINGFITV